MSDVAAAPYVPPGPHPGCHEASLVDLLRWGRHRPLESWPREVFEELSYRPPIPGLPLFLMDPEAIRAMCVEEADAFDMTDMWRRVLLPVWGEGMMTSRGPKWRWQRRASAPAFRPADMPKLAPAIGQVADAALERWGDGAHVDFAVEAEQLMLDVVMDTVLSGGEGLDRESVAARIRGLLFKILKPRLELYIAPDGWHDGRPLPPIAESESLRSDVELLIRRRREGPPRGDLLDLLMNSRDPESGRPMDEVALRDNIVGFMVGAPQTSAVALTWCVFLVSQHDPTAARIRAEVAEVAGDAPIGAEHVDKLVFTRQVVNETLRLYPPGLQLYRVCRRAATVGRYSFEPGDKVLVPVYALHRHRLWWGHPDVFDPDRFAPDRPFPDRHLFQPFGVGGRVCIGAAFAMTKLVVLLATLTRGATFTVDPDHRVWPGAGMEMMPRGGLPMTVAPRR